MKHYSLFFFICLTLYPCDNNEISHTILQEENRFQILKERYPYDEFSGLALDAISKDGAISIWQGFAGPHDERFLHKEYVQIFLTPNKETDHYLRDKKIDWLQKSIINNNTIFSKGNWDSRFEVDFLNNGTWNIQRHEMPFYSHFCLDRNNKIVYFFGRKGQLTEYSIAPFAEIQSHKFIIPDTFVDYTLLLSDRDLLCYVVCHGLYHFNLSTSEARSMGKHYESGFKKSDSSPYMLAMFHKCTKGCWEYKKELRVLNLKKGNSKKRFFIEWSIPDKNRRIAHYDFLPNQDDYFIVSYYSSKKGCAIYSFKSRTKIARIYMPQISRFFFPTNDQIGLYLGDLQTKQLKFTALIDAYQKQNDNGKIGPLIVGKKYWVDLD